jgi:hypothetical protein
MIMTKFTLFLLAIPFFSACNQNSDDHKKIEGLSEKKISESDSESKKERNFIYHHTNIIRDSFTAIKISEAILFGIYGKDEITKQKPYLI